MEVKDDGLTAWLEKEIPSIDKATENKENEVFPYETEAKGAPSIKSRQQRGTIMVLAGDTASIESWSHGQLKLSHQEIPVTRKSGPNKDGTADLEDPPGLSLDGVSDHIQFLPR